MPFGLGILSSKAERPTTDSLLPNCAPGMPGGSGAAPGKPGGGGGAPGKPGGGGGIAEEPVRISFGNGGGGGGGAPEEVVCKSAGRGGGGGGTVLGTDGSVERG